MFCNSEVIVFCTSTTTYPKESSVELSVVSSANKIKLNLVLDLTMPLINMLNMNRSGPIMDP